MRAAKVQASLRIRAVSPEPPLLAHTSSESRGTFRQKAKSLAPLNGWACAVKICHDGMLEDTNSLDAVHMHGSDFINIQEDPVWGTTMFSTPIGNLTNFSGGKENQSISEINNFFTRTLIKILNGRKLDIYLLNWLA